jgi:hypothetical protein
MVDEIKGDAAATTILSQEKIISNADNPLVHKSLEHYYYSDDNDEALQGIDATKISKADTIPKNIFDTKKINCWNGFLLCFCIPKKQIKTKSKTANQKSSSFSRKESPPQPIIRYDNGHPSITTGKRSPKVLPGNKGTAAYEQTQKSDGEKTEDNDNEYKEHCIEQGNVTSIIDENEFLDADDGLGKSKNDVDNLSVEREKKPFYVSSAFFACYSPNNKRADDENMDFESGSPTSSKESPLSERSYNELHADIANENSCNSSVGSHCAVFDPNESKIAPRKTSPHQAFMLEFLKTLLQWMFLNRIAAAVISIGSRKKHGAIVLSCDKKKED